MVGIYKITNKINGRCYIGQSINIKQRWKDHRKDAFWKNDHNYNYPLYKAIRKYGIENFSFEVLEECSQELLNEREIYYIQKYNSLHKGYNQNEGGNHSHHPIKLNEHIVAQIIMALKTSTKSNTELAKEFQVSEGMIRAINLGSNWHQPNETYPLRIPRNSQPKQQSTKKTKEIKRENHSNRQNRNRVIPDAFKRNQQRKVIRPLPLELSHNIICLGFVKTGQLYGVTDNAIKKWCKSYGLPYKKAEIVDWYTRNVKTLDEETLQKATYNIKKAVQQIDRTTGQVIAEFSSIGEACSTLGGKSANNIARVCQGNGQSAYGYSWRYIQ